MIILKSLKNLLYFIRFSIVLFFFFLIKSLYMACLLARQIKNFFKKRIKMAYKFDHDLEFLFKLESEKLNDLVEILTTDKGEARLTETLTGTEKYKAYAPNHSKYVDLICEELQRFGGNTFANTFRGGGVLYREIVKDVCSKLKVKFQDSKSTTDIEIDIMLKILQDSMEKMDQEQLKELIKELDLKTTSISASAITIAMQAAIKMGGFASYQLAVIVANAIAKAVLGHGLSLAANATITRTIGIFAGPIGWALSGAWLATDIAGPAYRVTIPAVIQVAFLRQNYLKENKAI